MRPSGGHRSFRKRRSPSLPWPPNRPQTVGAQSPRRNLLFGPGIARLIAARVMNRRSFLFTGAVFGASINAATPANPETVYRFDSANCDIRMSVEFFDDYSSDGFWFRERMANRRFCLSGAGDENRSCLANFVGSVAIARYRVQPREHKPAALALREYVRTIDQDARLDTRAPFQRTIELQDGVASDIQAFGYQPEGSSLSRELRAPDRPWCVLRQDLYLLGQDAVFLVLHWKHTPHAIRLFDVIPGDLTRVIAEPDAVKRGRR
jgi:hypothetical protein